MLLFLFSLSVFMFFYFFFWFEKDSFFKELKGHSKNRLEMAIKKVSIFPLISYFFKEKPI